MTDIVALAKLLAQQAGTAQRITRERGFPLSKRPLVMIPIVMAGESPALFGLGVGDGFAPVRVHACANPINRDEQYAMLADALKAVEPTIRSWGVSSSENPQIVVTGADSARLVLGLIDRMVYSQRAQLSTVGRQLAWFDKRSDAPDSACLLVLPKALAAYLATGQDEFADQHLGALLEWCAPADGKIWERVARAEQLPASGATSPEFDRGQMEPAFDAYAAAVRDGNASAAARARKGIEKLIGEEIRRRYRLAVAALRELGTHPESAVAVEIAAEDRRSFLDHLAYVADPNNHLRRGLDKNMQTSEFMSREFAVGRVNELGVRSVSGAYAKAKLSGDLLEGEVVVSTRTKVGRRTSTLQTIASTQQQLSLRAGDKLTLLTDERFIFRVEDIGLCPRTGRTLVGLEVTNGKTLPSLPSLGAQVTMAPPLRDRHSLSRARNIAWARMRARPAAVPAPQAPAVSRDWARLVNSLRGQR